MFKLKLISLLFFITLTITAQQTIIDRVIGVVGKYPILLSDLQNAMLEREKEGLNFDKCKSFEILIYEKLLLAQADRDSITVVEEEVERELTKRMNYFISQFGSEVKLEEFYGKKTNVIKDELRSEVEHQLVAEKMKSKIIGQTKLTPAEVRLFFNSISIDSLPLIESELELQQLVKKPTYSNESKIQAKELIETYRQRVSSGEANMSTLARLYSEDPGSAQKGGFYANVGKGVMDPVFESVAFRLKKGEISQVFETSYGFHFIELVQRKGELIDLRHILIIPKMTNDDFFKCKKEIDSLQILIKEGKLTFEQAVKQYSDDLDTKQNSGLMINPQNASTKFNNVDLTRIDQNLIVTLNSMNNGDISKSMQFLYPDGKPGFRILKLKNRIDPHKSNLKEDYQRLVQMATIEKNKSLIKQWIKKRSKITYMMLDKEFTCKFENEWVINN